MTLLAKILASCGLAFVATAHAQDVPRGEAAFTSYVADALRKEVGSDAVVVKGPLTLGLGELQANLDRIYRFCVNNSAACATEIEGYVKGAAQVHRERNTPPSREAVRVVVRTAQYAETASLSTGNPGPVGIMPKPFVEGLVALPVLDTPRAIKMLGSKDARGLGLSEEEAYELGIANLRRDLKPLMEVAKVARKGQIGQLVGDPFYPSRLLLLETWAPLAKAQGGVLIVSIPATDAVLYIGEETRVAIDALRSLTANVMSRAPNRLSAILLRWTELGWQPIP